MKRFLAIPFLLFVAIVAGFTVSDSKNNQISPAQNVSLVTGDKVKLAGDYYPGTSRNGVVLLHMMSETRRSWVDFSRALQARGFSVLAIDLRGHGESEGGPSGYRSFSDLEHQKSINDVAAAVDFLKDRGIVAGNITLVGASIGANLVLQYVAEHHEIFSAVMLSPGLDYRGVKSLPAVSVLIGGQRIFIAASDDDDLGNVSATTVARAIMGQLPRGVEGKLLTFAEAGHGTRLFSATEPNLTVELLDWIH